MGEEVYVFSLVLPRSIQSSGKLPRILGDTFYPVERSEALNHLLSNAVFGPTS